MNTAPVLTEETENMNINFIPLSNHTIGANEQQ